MSLFIFNFEDMKRLKPSPNTRAHNKPKEKQAEEIYSQFRVALKQGEISHDKIRPHDTAFIEPIYRLLQQMKDFNLPENVNETVEIFVVDNYFHFLVPVEINGQEEVFCFSILIDGSQWFFNHMETITIRLDQVSPPTSNFPDISDDKKFWILEEIYWSKLLNIYNQIVTTKSKQNSIDLLFKDGEGYFLEAKTWVPYLEPWKAFILYLCWEQKNLRGSLVELKELNNRNAHICLEPVFLKLYNQSAHFQLLIDKETYLMIFETIWQDRAKHAGWELEIEYLGEHACKLYFSRN